MSNSIEAAHKRITLIQKRVKRNSTILSFLIGMTIRDLANVPEWVIDLLKEIVLNL